MCGTSCTSSSPHSCSFLLDGLANGRDDVRDVCRCVFDVYRVISAARGGPFASVTVPLILTIASLIRFWCWGASAAEDYDHNEASQGDSTHNAPLAVGMMLRGKKFTREWLAQTAMKVCIQLRHLRIVHKRTAIADTLTDALLFLERYRITWRWLCRQGLKERRLHYVTEAKDFTVVRQAHAVLRSHFHKVCLHVQVDIVFALEDFAGIVTHPLTFGSSLILLMPPEDINPRAEGTSIWPIP